jgi:UDP-GlcNAc:undecaprenyl-phosphate GlcNAc-1-phosphate transferase
MMFEALTPLIGFFVGFAVVAVLIPPLCRLAVAKGFVDKPGGRKIHDTLTPPIGGIIIFSVFMIIALLKGTHLETVWPLFAALSLLLVTGAVDDYRHISPWIKFSMQFVAAGLIVLPGGAELIHLDNIFGLGTLWLGFMSVPFSIISVVLFINAINLMDGLDGLAGGVSFIALVWLLIGALAAGLTFVAYPMLLLMGALAGFLLHNMRSPFNKRAKLFLGDAGSMGFGLVLAWFCIKLVQQPLSVMPPISVAWIIALPIIDTCAQFYRRARLGRHPFSPDKGHFHHHFIEAGYPVGKATALILLISFILGGIGYLGYVAGLPQWVLTALWVVMILTHMWVSDKPERYTTLLRTKSDS